MAPVGQADDSVSKAVLSLVGQRAGASWSPAPCSCRGATRVRQHGGGPPGQVRETSAQGFLGGGMWVATA